MKKFLILLLVCGCTNKMSTCPTYRGSSYPNKMKKFKQTYVPFKMKQERTL